MPDDQAADYAEDPRDLRPAVLDRVFAHLQPLDFLFLAVTPCFLFAPVIFVIAAWGLLACRVPAARRNAWLLLIIMAAPTALISAVVAVPRVVRWF